MSTAVGGDVFQRVNDLDAATVQRLADRMESRQHDPAFAGWRDAYLDRLDSAGTVLEVGCGTATVARALAARPGFRGRVLATDYSQALLDLGRDLAVTAGIADRLDMGVQDAHALTLPDASVDTAIAHTLVSHLADPLRALSELARVVRPGGTIVVFDGDYASLSFGARDRALGETVEQALVATVAANPTVLRTLPRRAAALNLTIVDATAHVLAEVGTGGFFLNFAETYGPMAADAGLVPSAQLSTWWDEQRTASRAGGFFAACNYYTYLLGRP